MINKPINAVKKFHKSYELLINNSPTVNLDKELIKLRFNLMKEENEEYLQAARKKDIIEVADALGDMLYILCGTIITHGFQYKIEEVFDEIHGLTISDTLTCS